MLLIQHNLSKLEEIKNLLKQLPETLYVQPKKILSQSTIGQHFRHILEFYICLEKGFSTGTICYDARKRDVLIETDVSYAIEIIENLKKFLNKISKDSELQLKANYTTNAAEDLQLQTSVYRELAYALDHTIHHLAIIKIALINENFEVDENFGVAISTIRHRKVCAQ